MAKDVAALLRADESEARAEGSVVRAAVGLCRTEPSTGLTCPSPHRAQAGPRAGVHFYNQV